MSNIAIIPARSGSKGLKNKNIKPLNGKPLIWYSIKAALDSACFDEVILSTDSEEYAQIGRVCGASVPFLRSKGISGDKASSWDSVKEVLLNCQALDKTFDTVMLLQPTSPLRTAEDIVRAFNIMRKNNADSVVSVCEMEHSPLWSNTLPENGNLQGFIRPEVDKISDRQGLPSYYRINGAIYLTKINYETLNFSLYNENGYAYKMSQMKSIDIDTELDFFIAEQIIKNYRLEGV